MNYGESGLSASDVALISGRNNDNSGFGDNNGWWVILFLLVLFGGWGNRGFGGFGGCGGGSNGGTSVYEGYVLNNDFSQLSKQISDTYNMTDRKFDAITNGICSLGYQELQNINGVNTNISNGVYGITNAITTNGYETRIGINGIGTQLANCCCDLRQQISDVGCATNRNIDAVNYNMAMNTNTLNNTINTGFNGVQQSMCLNTRDIVDNQNAGTRAILDAITANRIEDKNAQIQAQQAKISALELAASQAAQNNYLVDKLGYHMPVAAYQVPNPYCNCNNNCGCNCGC